MGKTPLERDGADIGFAIMDGHIHTRQKQGGGPMHGPLVGARISLDQSVGRPSMGARMVTSLKDQGKLQGRARVMVTVACADGVTLINEVPAKHELAARRWVAAASAAATVLLT